MRGEYASLAVHEDTMHALAFDEGLRAHAEHVQQRIDKASSFPASIGDAQ